MFYLALDEEKHTRTFHFRSLTRADVLDDKPICTFPRGHNAEMVFWIKIESIRWTHDVHISHRTMCVVYFRNAAWSPLDIRVFDIRLFVHR